MKIFTNNTLDQLTSEENTLPFNPTTLKFIKHFSNSILSDKSLKIYPDVMSLAFWFRNVTYKHTHRPRGIVLHIAPSNVNTIFIYSLFLSMLCGNKNIVKLPRKITTEVQILVDKLNECCNEYPEINKKLFICNYEHDENVTKQLSDACDVRVIWGGDETVKYFRTKHPLKPLSTELAFPNRFSFSVINIEKLDNVEDLAKKFYNDAFLFSQQACSSPKVIFWVGKKNEKYNEFWECVRKETYRFDNNATMVIDRLVAVDEIITRGNIVHGDAGSFPVRIECNSLKHVRDYHCGNGLFFELMIDKLEDVLNHTEDKDQTMIQYGFSKDELNSFVSNIKNRSIDRIVNFGQALDFNYIWDGINLYDAFSRQITVT